VLHACCKVASGSQAGWGSCVAAVESGTGPSSREITAEQSPPPQLRLFSVLPLVTSHPGSHFHPFPVGSPLTPRISLSRHSGFPAVRPRSLKRTDREIPMSGHDSDTGSLSNLGHGSGLLPPSKSYCSLREASWEIRANTLKLGPDQPSCHSGERGCTGRERHRLDTTAPLPGRGFVGVVLG
jgi:hypothetical protein